MSIRTPRTFGVNALLLGLGISLGISCWPAAGSLAASRNVLGGAKQTESSVSSQSKNSIEKKLGEILANQETILQRLDQVMEELRIIKVRATLRGGS